MKARIFTLLSLIMVMALLVPGGARPSTAQSQPPSTRTPLTAAPRSEPGKFIKNVDQFAPGARFRPYGGDQDRRLAEEMTITTTGTTTRVSVASDGMQGNSGSYGPSISADGRYVAFGSGASNLVSGDTNGHWDVFVHDQQTGQTERVSIASDGTQGNGGSGGASISADGRYVAFWLEASNLVSGDTNGYDDVFVHDRTTGQTERVSVASNGNQGNGGSWGASISVDGRYVAFGSEASNLVSGDTNGHGDVFVHDRTTGQTERVSVASNGNQGNGDSRYPSISADGRHVAFESDASNLVSGDTNHDWDVFVHDRTTGQTERISVASNGNQGNGGSGWPSISADGRYVAFESGASNLVSGDTNHKWDVFVHDRQTGQTERVSVASNGAQGNEASYWGAISTDGYYVAFLSSANNLVSGDTNDTADVFVHDRITSQTTRASVSSDGTQGNYWTDDSSRPSDGCSVAFDSFANNLVSGDTNDVADVFFHEGDCEPPLTPVIIVPGYGASLFFRGSFGWMPTAKKTYDELIEALKEVGYESGENLIIGHYPWWRPNTESAAYLANRWVAQALEASPNDKVHIITHSNGGLVARQYIQSIQPPEDSPVDKLIMIAPPSQGVPKVYYYWGGGAFPPGDFTGWLGLERVAINMISTLLCPGVVTLWGRIRQCVPSFQELMPVADQNYLFNVNTGEWKKPSGLTEENQNPTLDALNDDAAINDLFNAIEEVTIYGSSVYDYDTLSKLWVKNRGILDWQRWADGKPIPGQDEGEDRGDGTIPEIHQRLPGCTSSPKCQEDFETFNADHRAIVSQVSNCVLYDLGLADECEPAPVVLESVSDADVVFFGMVTEAGWLISDPQGQRVGYSSNGQFVSEIPGVELFEGAEYHVIGIPEPITGDYTVQVTGIAGTQSYNVGSFTYLSGDTLLEAEGTVSSGSTRTVTAPYAPPSTLTGNVTLQGRPSSPVSSWVMDLDIGLYLPSDDSLLYSHSITTDVYGRFTLPNVPRGTYNIWVKGSHTLSNVKSNVSIGVGTNEVNFGTLLEGDANNDNCINAPDFSILRTAFGKCQGQEGYDARADFDQDGCVNAPDFSLLSTNFGLCGDTTVGATEGAREEQSIR